MEDGQTVSIFPDNFGSLILRRIMKEKGIKTRVIVAGYDSLVYGARLVEYNNLETETDVVNITYRENEIRVDTPVLHAMTGLSNIMMKTDYYQQGYTMKDLGLDGMSPAEMVAYMRTGETRYHTDMKKEPVPALFSC